MSIFVRHVATVPANCSISLTSEDEYVEAALPWNSSISFPSETVSCTFHVARNGAQEVNGHVKLSLFATIQLFSNICKGG